MTKLGTATWPDIERLRTAISAARAATVEDSAVHFATTFANEFPSVVLSRVFLVLPFERLPPFEQRFATAFVEADARLGPSTPVLTLLATRGEDPAWNDRTLSGGHLAIPLLDKKFVQGAPMIAKLLSDLEVDLAGLDDGLPIATRRLLGGSNGTFYVPDAQTARDDRDRYIIPSRPFVANHQVRTVFGMGGAYVDGTLAILIFFSTELLDRPMVDRYPSFVGTFKMATAALVAAGKIFHSE